MLLFFVVVDTDIRILQQMHAVAWDSSGAMKKNLSSAFSFWIIPTNPLSTCSVNGLWPVRIMYGGGNE